MNFHWGIRRSADSFRGKKLLLANVFLCFFVFFCLCVRYCHPNNFLPRVWVAIVSTLNDMLVGIS